MKIINKNFNLIPNCKKFKIGGKYDCANIYKAMGFDNSITNFEIDISTENKTYILQMFLEIKGTLEVEVQETKYTQRKCEELSLGINEYEKKINNFKLNTQEAKLFTKLEHRDFLEIVKNASFSTKIFLKQLNSEKKQEVLNLEKNKSYDLDFISIEEFYEFYSDDKTIKSFIKSLL